MAGIKGTPGDKEIRRLAERGIEEFNKSSQDIVESIEDLKSMFDHISVDLQLEGKMTEKMVNALRDAVKRLESWREKGTPDGRNLNFKEAAHEFKLAINEGSTNLEMVAAAVSRSAKELIIGANHIKESLGSKVGASMTSVGSSSGSPKALYYMGNVGSKIIKGIGTSIKGVIGFFISRAFWGKFANGIMEGTRHLLKKGVWDLILSGVYQALISTKKLLGTTGTRILLGIAGIAAAVSVLPTLAAGFLVFKNLPRILQFIGGAKSFSSLNRRISRIGDWAYGKTKNWLGGGKAKTVNGITEATEELSKKPKVTTYKPGETLKGDFKWGSTASKVGESRLLKGLTGTSKRMPLIGSLIAAGMEVPDLIQASKEGRLGEQATISTGGVAGGLAGGWGGAAAGAALGTLIAPGIGTAIGGVIGGVAGGIIGDKVGRETAKGTIEVGKKISESTKENAKSSEKIAKSIESEEGILDKIYNTLMSWFPWIKRDKEGKSDTSGSVRTGSIDVSKIDPSVLKDVKVYSGKTETKHNIQAVPLSALGISGGGSLPYIAAENTTNVQIFDKLVKSLGYEPIYTSAMGGHGEGTGHWKGNKIDVKFKKDGKFVTPDQSFFNLLRSVGFINEQAGAIGWHQDEGGKDFHADLFVGQKNIINTLKKKGLINNSNMKNVAEVVPTGIIEVTSTGVTTTKGDVPTSEPQTSKSQTPSNTVVQPSQPKVSNNIIRTEAPSTGESIDIKVAGLANLMNIERLMIDDFMYS